MAACASSRAVLLRRAARSVAVYRAGGRAIVPLRGWPHRLVGAERHGRTGPEGRSLGQLQGRGELAQAAEGRVGVGVEDGVVTQADGLSRVAARAEALEEHAGL